MEELSTAVLSRSEIETLIYKTSHNLTSPLTSIEGLLNVLKTGSSNQDQVISQIENSVSKLKKYTHQVIRKLNNNVKPVTNQQIVIGGFYEEIVSRLKSNLDNFDEKLLVSHFEPYLNFQSDKSRLLFIVEQLLSNAFIHGRTARRILKVTIDIEVKNENLMIMISDNGRGIEENIQKHIFDMFYTATDLPGCNGLGLYLAKEEVLALDGSIQMESKIGLGTKLFVQIPL